MTVSRTRAYLISYSAASNLDVIFQATCTAVRWNAPCRSFRKPRKRCQLIFYPSAPWSATIGIGNILRHEYQRLDDTQPWEIVTIHLPKLQPIVAQMLTELGA